MSEFPYADILAFIRKHPDTLDAWALGRLLASLRDWSAYPYSAAEIERLPKESAGLGVKAVGFHWTYGDDWHIADAFDKLIKLQPWLVREAIARIEWFDQRRQRGELKKYPKGKIIAPGDHSDFSDEDT